MTRRILLATVWACILGYFTCSVNPFVFQVSHFHFVRHARFQDLLIMDIHLFQPSWVLSKCGHFVGFMVMDALLYNVFRRPLLAATLAILFGVSTELSQLFFSRDGRIYDMIIDSLGATLSYYIQRKMRIE